MVMTAERHTVFSTSSGFTLEALRCSRLEVLYVELLLT